VVKEITIYTDGSSRGNPGPGGFGVVLMYQSHRKEISGGYKRTTNNRMELMAVIEGLKALKTPDIPVVIYSDSQYEFITVEGNIGAEKKIKSSGFNTLIYPKGLISGWFG